MSLKIRIVWINLYISFVLYLNGQRAVVKYDDGKGNKKEFVFEGDGNEIRKQIIAQDDMDEDKKQSLLHALDLNQAPSNNFNQSFPMPDWFQR